MIGWLALDGAMLVSLLGIGIFGTRFNRSLDGAPRLQPVAADEVPARSIAVIIPAYNEEINIEACARAALASELPNSVTLQVWVADDQSTDRTLAIAANLATQEPRLRVLPVPPRPTGEVWRGKNWACHWAQQVAAADGGCDYLLFIDADVRLTPGAIAAALTEADRRQTDLLSCAPEVVCGCLSEWLVQPIIMGAIAVGFDFPSLNDPANPKGFAAGPFMLFRRSAYESIGGHASVADDLVEDMALGQRIKDQGHRLYCLLGLGLVRVRMYQNFAALWEGWTKNWYLGNDRQLIPTLYGCFGLFSVFSLPWLGVLAAAIALGWWGPSLLGELSLGLTIATTIALCWMRHIIDRRVDAQPKYWWLMGLGGALVLAIALTSIVKTETGWGWTWRGRSLASS